MTMFIPSFCAKEFASGLIGKDSHTFEKVRVSTWVYANIVDKRVAMERADGESHSSEQAIVAILEEVFAARLAEGERADQEEEAYELRRGGWPWLAVSRSLGKAEEVCKALALCYCHRPVTEGRKPLRWWE
jgi:hypothetical protein